MVLIATFPLSLVSLTYLLECFVYDAFSCLFQIILPFGFMAVTSDEYNMKYEVIILASVAVSGNPSRADLVSLALVLLRNACSVLY